MLTMDGHDRTRTFAASFSSAPLAGSVQICVQKPCRAVKPPRSTAQACAAASFSRSRAEAPACMMCGCCWRTTCEPCVVVTMYSWPSLT